MGGATHLFQNGVRKLGLNAPPAIPNRGAVFACRPCEPMSSHQHVPTPESRLAIRSEGGAVSFDVVVVPRASRSRICGMHADSLKVTLAAAPVDGEANRELCGLIAKLLGVPKRSVQITRGEHSKHKTVQVVGVSAERVLELTKDDE